MPRAQFMRENQPSKFTEILIWIFVFLMGTFAVSNVLQGKVTHPWSSIIMFIGFVLFFISKLSVILKKKWISFGTRSMSAWMANIYRIGYWLMIFGFLGTFAP